MIRWLQRTSWGNAQVHLLTGDTLTAEEAYRIGLVQEIVASPDVMDRGFAIASTIADAAPLGVRHSLAVSRAAIDEGPLAAAEKIAKLRAEIVETEDAAEGVRSFLESARATTWVADGARERELRDARKQSSPRRLWQAVHRKPKTAD